MPETKGLTPEEMIDSCYTAMDKITTVIVKPKTINPDNVLADILHCLFQLTKLVEVLLIAQRGNVSSINQLLNERQDSINS